MDREAYRAASFLDDRMLQQPVDAHIVPWPEVDDAMPRAGRASDARWIFHIGHVGSTLVSRLLGETRRCACVREPRLLRDLALSSAEVRARLLPGDPTELMSRTFARRRIRLRQGDQLRQRDRPRAGPAGSGAVHVREPRAITSPASLPARIRVHELRMLAPAARERMAGASRRPRPPRNDAELAAAAWACEMTALEAAAEAMPDRHDRLGRLRPDAGDMPAQLSASPRFFGFAADPSELARDRRRTADGPLFEGARI